MTSETNIFSFGESSDPMEKARAALRAARQYHQDWQECGVDRVHKYFDDVEGDWLENFDEIKINNSSKSLTNVSFSDVISQLKSLGLSSYFIEKVALPSWWKSESGGGEEVTHRLLQSLAKRLNLEVNFLQGSSELSLQFAPIPSRKYKLTKRQGNPELFSYLANSISNTVLETVDLPYVSVPSDPFIIREAVLGANSYISLDSLLEFCWDCGLPIVHFDISNLFGKGNRRPNKSDGLVVMTRSRPVVIIGSCRQQSSWLLFILAHELGHIAQGHLKEGILSDESFQNGASDDEEDAANQFAYYLLFGDFSPKWTRISNYKTLLAQARQLSQEQNLDPGALILNYGWQTGKWACAMAALKRLEPDANAPAQINAYYKRYLVSIDEETRDYLERVNVLAA